MNLFIFNWEKVSNFLEVNEKVERIFKSQMNYSDPKE